MIKYTPEEEEMCSDFGNDILGLFLEKNNANPESGTDTWDSELVKDQKFLKLVNEHKEEALKRKGFYEYVKSCIKSY